VKTALQSKSMHPPADIEIRPATPDDAAAILHCLATAFAPYQKDYSPAGFTDTVLTNETVHLRLQQMHVMVAIADGKVIGTVAGLCNTNISNPNLGSTNISATNMGNTNMADTNRGKTNAPDANPGEGHLRGMAVLPDWHGSGVAAKLLSAIEAWLRSKGCKRITLDTTLPLKTAMRFYEKHGYHRSGKIADFFGMELVEYEKQLE